MTDIAMFNCLLIIFTREKSHRNRQAKMWYNEKAFHYKPDVLFQIDDCQQLTELF